MGSSSILCSSNSLTCSQSFSASQPLRILPWKKINFAPNSSNSRRLTWISLQIRPPSRSIVHPNATQEFAETMSSASGFVETGYIFGVHGLKGEVRVKPSTDFPNLRFSKPGIRWLKQLVSGIETLQEIELVEGRGHAGQNWIVRFNNINTVEQAQKLVGSTILVTDEDRPVLEEGEFYTHDLIGMSVKLKESGEPVGTVVNVFNSGASDLLHVKLQSLRNIPGHIGKSKHGVDDSSPLAWVPFVEAIVPIVDLETREMFITPPKGLLELNIRSDERSKKERRELEWKQRKRFQRRLIAAKKKLCEMEQQHVFDGFRYGEKDQKKLLANQIVTVNSKLLQQAMQNIETLSTRPNLLHILSDVPRAHTIRVSDSPSSACCKLQGEGHLLNSNGKVAICLVLEEIEDAEKGPAASLVKSEGNEDAFLHVKTLLNDNLRFVEIKDRPTLPLVVVCSAGSVNFLQELFSNHDYFTFDPEKVWFLEEERLPVVSSSFEGHGKHKILMKSPWEFLQRSIGSGGVIKLLSSQESLLDQLGEMGVEYFEVCKISRKHENSHTLLGLVDSLKANVGICLFKDIALEQDFDVVVSMGFVRKLMKQINKLRFHAVLACNSHVEKVGKDWVDVVPSAPNSYELRSSIYSCLDASPISKVCVLDSTE